MISHITLGTDDMRRAIGFYDPVMATLGLTKVMDVRGAVAYAQSEDERPWIFVLRPFDGGPASVGNGSHVAFLAPSRAAVRRFHETALGSGGSNRIRTAIFQVLVNLIDQGMTLEEAVEAPRLHVEHGVANAEGGLDEACRAALASTDEPFAESVMDWPRHNLFFGGVHAVSRDESGTVSAAGDPRRGGATSVD